MKRLICVLFALALLTSCALAESTVEYRNSTDLFEFKPGSSYNATDLFMNFKGVLPGDVLEQKIVVRNTSQWDVRIWLQQDPETKVTTDAEDFLKQLDLKVTQNGKTLFDAKASESAQLTKPVLLGFFDRYPQGETTLSVTLTVPSDLGNEYMGQVGEVPWTFIVEEIPDAASPHTGDWYQSGAWLALAGGLLLAIVFVLVLMRRRKTAE